LLGTQSTSQHHTRKKTSMFDRTQVYGLPTWAVVLIVIVVAIAACDIVSNITKVWREPKPKPPTTTRRGLLDVVQEGEQKRNG
jgi:hypothetical protein